MPQMKSLLWLMMMLFSFFYFIMLMITIYFTSIFSNPNHTRALLPSQKNSSFFLTWKW